MNAYVMYNVRRNVIKEMRINETMLMKEEIVHSQNWTNIKTKKTNFAVYIHFTNL